MKRAAWVHLAHVRSLRDNHGRELGGAAGGAKGGAGNPKKAAQGGFTYRCSPRDNHPYRASFTRPVRPEIPPPETRP